jgi:Domain of unknown function (DUF4136)
LAYTLAIVWALAGCSGVDIQTSDTVKLENGHYQSYSWQNAPLPREGRWTDPIYRLDPAIRTAIEEGLLQKGYTAVSEGADFTVRYVYAPGYLSGVEPEQSHTISPVPRPRDLEPTNQASVDNAIALGGIKQTTNINITLIDSGNSETLWTATVSMIVEDANNRDSEEAKRKISRFVKSALSELPVAGK